MDQTTQEYCEALEVKVQKTIKDIEKRYMRITFRYAEKVDLMKQVLAGTIDKDKIAQYWVQLDLMNDHDWEAINKANAEFMLHLFEPVAHHVQ